MDGPTMLSGGSPICTYPNVDQLENGAAFVWEEEGSIKGRYWTTLGMLASPAMGPITDLSPCTIGTNHRPDVSVYRDGPNDQANIVYINTNSSGHTLMLQRYDLDDFYAGVGVSCTELSSLHTVTPNWSLGEPRVASPVIGTGDFRDCEVVVDQWAGSTSIIVGVNRHEATLPGAYTVSQLNAAMPVSTTACGNRRPVVTYTGCDKMVVEWEYIDCAGTLGLPGSSIVARYLAPDGTIAWPLYSQVNNGPGFHITASVAGRYRAGMGNKVLSTYNDAGPGDMLYKWSPCNNPSMKQEPTIAAQQGESELLVSPNPTANQVRIRLPENGDVSSVAIVTMQGQVVHQWLALPEGTRQLDWDAETLPAGLYLVRCLGSTGMQTTMLQKVR